MTIEEIREERCLLAIKKGYTYNPTTGGIYGIKGNEIKRKHCDGYILISLFEYKNKYVNILGNQFAYYFIHRKIVEFIDHKNGIRTDNRISNLRPATKQENSFNRKDVKGYSLNGNNKYTARIVIKKKTLHLGDFNTEQEASNAYLDAKKIYHTI